MALEKGSIVEIRQAANGYIVMPPPAYERTTVIGDSDRYVFQSFAELVEWMGKHFTHRASGVTGDSA